MSSGLLPHNAGGSTSGTLGSFFSALNVGSLVVNGTAVIQTLVVSTTALITGILSAAAGILTNTIANYTAGSSVTISTSSANANILLSPNGTGKVAVSTNLTVAGKDAVGRTTVATNYTRATQGVLVTGRANLEEIFDDTGTTRYSTWVDANSHLSWNATTAAVNNILHVTPTGVGILQNTANTYAFEVTGTGRFSTGIRLAAGQSVVGEGAITISSGAGDINLTPTGTLVVSTGITALGLTRTSGALVISTGAGNINLAPSTGVVDASASQVNCTGVNFGDQTFGVYKTGTFTVTITFGGGNTGITYSVQRGRYTQMGRCLFIEIFLILSNKGSSTGVASIVTGLASGFNAATPSTGVSWFAVPNNITLAANYYSVSLQPDPAATTAGVYATGTGNASVQLTDTAFANNSAIQASGFWSL